MPGRCRALLSASALALASIAVALPGVASAYITPVDAAFTATSTTSLVVRTPLATVTCTGATLAGQTPSSSSATALSLSSTSFTGCTSTLGSATVSGSGTWSIGLPTPPSTAATLDIPTGGLSALLGGFCAVTGTGSIGGTWTDGGSAHDQDQPPSSQLALPGAGGLALSTCMGPTTGTVTASWNVTNTSSALALWTSADKYTVDPNPRRFPDVRVSGDSTRVVQLKNPGGAVTITRARVTGDMVFTVDLGMAGVTIPEESLTPLDVKFSPTREGEFRAKIELLDDNGTVWWTFTVTGRGVR